MSEIKRIAVFTSGGDAPGMNAAVRAVVRSASYYDLHVYGIMNGYEGMIEGNFKRLERKDVRNIIHRGGTILKTARSKEFMTKEGRQRAYDSLMANDIDACIAIGGNGTYTGAKVFMSEHKLPFIGLPGTIDNDIFGTDYSIGFDTAVNTAIDAVDKIRDTADSHNRIFFVEVMGRHSGYIGLFTGIGSGAGSILVPEMKSGIPELVTTLKKGIHRKRLFSIIIVAEGNKLGSATEIAEAVSKEIELDARVTIIGHLQRGGSPTAMDRMLASRLGNAAVEALLAGKKGVACGLVNGMVKFTPLTKAIEQDNPLNSELLKLAEILAL